MNKGFRFLVAAAAVAAAAGDGFAATNNSGNNPAFLAVQMVSNGWNDQGRDTIDIGVDIGADGTYDYWMSEDASFVREGATDRPAITPEDWMNALIVLDQYAGQMAKIQIVDRSDQYYIAVNSIRLNNADGAVVENPVPNGWFEDSPALTGWTVLEGNLSAGELIEEDTGVELTPNSTHIFNTGETGEGTAVIESDAFELTPVSSFIYGTFAGASSTFFDKPGAWGSENGVKVYVDVGTGSEDPDGEYTPGVDVPLTGMLYDDQNLNRISLQAAILNTSGLEGRRAQVVVEDDDPGAAVSVDCVRMNWDNGVIPNGGFEEGFEDGYPEGFQGFEVRSFSAHPSGDLPGWTHTHPADDEDMEFTFFGWPGAEWTRSGRVWVGSGSFAGDPAASEDPLGGFVDHVGLELRSSVFTIQPIPPASESVFMSFNSAQVSVKQNPNGEFKAVDLQVDVDGDGAFEGEGDFVYNQFNQGGGWNREQYAAGGIDEWQYPEYRFYIASEHQGLQGRIYVADNMTGGWAWLGVDDFYFWDGATADLAFPNSDFEMGDMTNWTEEIVQEPTLESWLSGTTEMFEAGEATHIALNDHISFIDGNFSADTANNQGGTGDDNIAYLWSEPFTIPALQGTFVGNWSLY